jgi:hypothetical protein
MMIDWDVGINSEKRDCTTASIPFPGCLKARFFEDLSVASCRHSFIAATHLFSDREKQRLGNFSFNVPPGQLRHSDKTNSFRKWAQDLCQLIKLFLFCLLSTRHFGQRLELWCDICKSLFRSRTAFAR